MNFRRLAVVGMLAGTVAAVAAGCSSAPSANNRDQAATGNQLSIYQANQPIPQSVFSFYRQTLIDVENAQIHGVATTSFFFNQGSTSPYKQCPSVGFPVASTSQLTNPQQIAWGANNAGSAVIAQMEPNGTFTGESTGTYVVCVAANGTKYVSYAEGFVDTEGGPAHWDRAAGAIVADGAPTVTATGK